VTTKTNARRSVADTLAAFACSVSNAIGMTLFLIGLWTIILSVPAIFIFGLWVGLVGFAGFVLALVADAFNTD
jgi:hypothetical protein